MLDTPERAPERERDSKMQNIYFNKPFKISLRIFVNLIIYYNQLNPSQGRHTDNPIHTYDMNSHKSFDCGKKNAAPGRNAHRHRKNPVHPSQKSWDFLLWYLI